jgi:hypothetical protein
MANQSTKTDYGILPLKGVVASLPFSILLHLWAENGSIFQRFGTRSWNAETCAMRRTSTNY